MEVKNNPGSHQHDHDNGTQQIAGWTRRNKTHQFVMQAREARNMHRGETCRCHPGLNADSQITELERNEYATKLQAL